MSATRHLLEVRNLRIEFPTRRQTLIAVDDISFSLDPGEVLGVVGESGAGKSLTGAAIIGLLEPPGRVASGEIYLDGKRVDNLPAEEMRVWVDETVAGIRETGAERVLELGSGSGLVLGSSLGPFTVSSTR